MNLRSIVCLSDVIIIIIIIIIICEMYTAPYSPR